jgi:hypothetical protein
VAGRMNVHQGLVLCPSHVPEEVGINKKSYSQHKKEIHGSKPAKKY